MSNEESGTWENAIVKRVITFVIGKRFIKLPQETSNRKIYQVQKISKMESGYD